MSVEGDELLLEEAAATMAAAATAAATIAAVDIPLAPVTTAPFPCCWAKAGLVEITRAIAAITIRLKFIGLLPLSLTTDMVPKTRIL